MCRSVGTAIRILFAGLILFLPLILGWFLFTETTQGRLHLVRVNLGLSIASLIVTIYVAIFTGFISWKALVFAALPRIAIDFRGETRTERKEFNVKENITLHFYLRNIGWWYAKPTASNIVMFVNFEPSFQLKQIRYGSNLELAEDEVNFGKQNCKYFKVGGIHLFPDEPGEYIEVDVELPGRAGSYSTWISARSDECDHGTFQFEISVG